MKLTEDWKLILRKAWSMRFVALGLVIGLAEQLVPQLQGQIDGRIYMALLALVGIARIIHQENVSGKKDA